jgi:cysteine desulfurase/selenocysteine lyase
MGADKRVAPGVTTEAGDLDVEQLRGDFPILRSTVRGKPLVYLDNAASTQKPRTVIEAVERYYTAECSNVHRGLHRLSERATQSFEAARDKIQRFVGAADRREIVFTSGTTGAINLVAHAFGSCFVGRDDEIVISHLEHHSNIVPWQLLCERVGAKLRVAPINDQGELIPEAFDSLLNDRTRLVCVTHTSNALGTRLPVEWIIELAHERDVPVLLDGAQAVAHAKVDVQALDCEFFAFSGHKMFGPTGVGVLYGKADWLERLPPFLGGGEMIHTVTFEKTTFKEPPQRFEAGTPDIAGAIGLGAAADYLQSVGMERIAAHERDLIRYALERLREIPRVRLIGASPHRASIVSFTVDGLHPHDLGTALDFEGVAVRAGHHCAQPLMERFNVPATVRASMACYNTREEIDVLAMAVGKAIEVLG